LMLDVEVEYQVSVTVTFWGYKSIGIWVSIAEASFRTP